MHLARPPRAGTGGDVRLTREERLGRIAAPGWEAGQRVGLDRLAVVDAVLRDEHPGVLIEGEEDKARRADDGREDRKSTRLNSSHLVISYAVLSLAKKSHSSWSSR